MNVVTVAPNAAKLLFCAAVDPCTALRKSDPNIVNVVGLTRRGSSVPRVMLDASLITLCARAITGVSMRNNTDNSFFMTFSYSVYGLGSAIMDICISLNEVDN